jgi:FlaA1/EpsC-like NDP-sugar epimerase
VDIEIAFTGMRPGEKLFEELSVDAEAAVKTRHPKIFVGRFRPHEWTRVEAGLERLLGLAGGTAAAVRGGLRELVPEYRPEVGEDAAKGGAGEDATAGSQGGSAG